jgi:hypothetical protein
MMLPAPTLRTNFGIWVVAPDLLDAIAGWMRAALPPESFDPGFLGQRLEPTYFDTCNLDLARARGRKDRYLTLRLRSYCHSAAHGLADTHATSFALSAKTESTKFRIAIPADRAHQLLHAPFGAEALAELLPPDLLARLMDLEFKSANGDQPVPADMPLGLQLIRLSKFVWAMTV